jgi:tetratricopeptide (TPR) repeat protein
MADPHGYRAATTSDMVPGTTIRFFLSSTFYDFQVERDVLQRRVFPELRRLCAESGFRLQPIDLRWGVSEAASIDRQTLRICFDELERCRQLSPDCFLLIQLGDRYGTSILPPQVPADLVATLLPYFAPEERIAFDASYRLDANAVPPEYVLLRAEGLERAEDEQLRLELARAGDAAGVSAEKLLPFIGSATHREIELGLLGVPAGAGQEAGVLCAVRRFHGEPRGSASARFVENDAVRVGRVRALTDAVLERVQADQVLRYEVDWRDDDGPVFDEDALTAAYLRLLRPKLEAVIAARTAALAAATARGRTEVALANAAFESDRAARVEGRDTELARLAAYLAGATGSGLPLVVAGAAGSGKSTLLAEAARRAAAAQSNAVLVVRYVGVTPGTESLAALLNDLRRAIARAYAQPEPAPLTDQNQLVGAVAAQLATLPAPSERPLLLIVDALDQLGDYTQRTDWLPPRLARHVRVVVSVLADRLELRYLADRLPAEQVLSLPALGRKAGRTLLHDLLGAVPARTLAPEQEEAVLAAFAPRGLPLHLRLLASEARRWRSFDLPRLGDAPLPEDTPELLQTILKRLEAPERNGYLLVARALGDLAAARFGLAEDELLDLLSRDEAVRAEQHELSPDSPPIDQRLPLPTALWARLYAEVEPLLTQRESDQDVRLYTFYHQQLRRAVEARYLVGAEGTERHRALADYFGAQHWQLAPRRWNWRKVRELVTQWEGAGDRAAAEQALAQLANEQARQQSSEADDPVGIIALIEALKDHLNIGGYWRVGQRLLEWALAMRLEVGDRAGAAATLNNLGLLADNLGRPDEAARYYEQALVIFRAVGDRADEGTALHNLGTLADPDEAARYYQQALAIRRAVGDRSGEAATLQNLGTLAQERGQLDEAAQHLQQALAIFREVGERAGEGAALHNLGALAQKRGQLDEAARYYQQALAIRRAVGDRPGEAATLDSLGNSAHDRGQLDEAAQYYQQALAIRREVGDRKGEGMTLNSLGALADNQQRKDEAARYYQQALAILREVGDRKGEGTALQNLGDLAHEMGNVTHNPGQLEEAAQHLQLALAIRRALRDRAGEAATLQNLGTVAHDRGNLARYLGRTDEAARYYQQALAIFREVGERKSEGMTLNNLGNVAEDQQRKDEAARYYQQALAIFRAVGDRFGEAATLQNLGTLAHEKGQRDEAAQYYQQALIIFDDISAVDFARMVRENLQILRTAPPPQPEHDDAIMPAERSPSGQDQVETARKVPTAQIPASAPFPMSAPQSPLVQTGGSGSGNPSIGCALGALALVALGVVVVLAMSFGRISQAGGVTDNSQQTTSATVPAQVQPTAPPQVQPTTPPQVQPTTPPQVQPTTPPAPVATPTPAGPPWPGYLQIYGPNCGGGRWFGHEDFVNASPADGNHKDITFSVTVSDPNWVATDNWPNPGSSSGVIPPQTTRVIDFIPRSAGVAVPSTLDMTMHNDSTSGPTYFYQLQLCPGAPQST